MLLGALPYLFSYVEKRWILLGHVHIYICLVMSISIYVYLYIHVHIHNEKRWICSRNNHSDIAVTHIRKFYFPNMDKDIYLNSFRG